MTDILNKTTKIADEHVDNNRTLFNSVWWFKNDSSTSVIGDYTVGNHTSLHDISCGWGHAKLTDADFNPQEAVAPDGLITKAIYDDFGSYAGLAQLRTNKPQAADDSGILSEPNITTGVTTTDVVMEGIKDHANTGGIDTHKPHQDTIHIISNELLKVENRYHCFIDPASYTNTAAAQTVTHSGNWGSYADPYVPLNYGDTLTAYIDLNFGTFLSARKWWNQGGKVTLDMNHTGGRDGSVNWNTFMDSFGKLYFSMAGDINSLAYGGVHWQNTNPSSVASSFVSYQHDGSTVALSNAGADLAANFGTDNASSNASGKKIVPYDYGTSYKLLFKAQQASNIYGGGGDSPGGSDPVPGEGAEVFVYGKRNADGSQYTFKVVLDNTKQGTVQDGNAVFKWGHVIPIDKSLVVGTYTANFTAETFSSFAKQSPTGTGGSGSWT
jgi:hypothetical protein